MYIRQTVEAGGNFYSEYGYEPEIEECFDEASSSKVLHSVPESEPSDIYSMGIEDGEAQADPTLPESLEYWDGWCFGQRSYWLKVQGKEELIEM